MYTIIGGDRKEYGPVTAEQLRQWIAEGRAERPKPTSAAEGSGEWKPLSTFPEFAEALRAASWPGAARWRGLPACLLHSLERTSPCAPTGGANRAVPWAVLGPSDCATSVCSFGATFLVWLITFGCQFIPLVGGIVNWLICGVLYGGLYLIFLNRIRGRPASIGDVFAGFSMGFVQLMLVGS